MKLQVKHFTLYLALFFIALIPRILFIILVPYHGPGGDEIGYDHLAWSLAQGKGFVDEFGNPTSFYFPAYPYFVAAIYKIFGHTYLPVFIAQALLSACLCVMIFVFARQLFGIMAAALSFGWSVIYPPFILYTGLLLGDFILTVLFFIFFMSLYNAQDKPKNRAMFFCGIFLGLCCLIRGECLFFLAVFFGYQFFSKSIKKFSAHQWGILLATFCLMLSPWMIRNAIIFRTFIPLSTRGGVTFYNSFFLPEQGYGYSQLKNLGSEYYALKTEVQKDRYFMRKTMHYIAHHPLKALSLIPMKLAYVVYPFDGQWYAVSLLSKYNIAFGIVFSFAIAGFILLRKEPAGLLLFLPVFAIFLSASIFYGKPRFRLMIEPHLILSCSFFIARWIIERPTVSSFFKKIFPVLLVNVFLFLFAGHITAVLRQMLNILLKMYPQG